MATNAEVIAHTLAEAGSEIAFGLPGGEVANLLAACRDAGIQFFLTGHEASAAIMAEVTGQITGRPGVCISTLGPGAMNLCLGVANAFLDRSPMLALTGELHSKKASYFSHQRLPLTKIFQHFTKLSVTLDGKGTASTMHRCIDIATTPRLGPVHVALPSDLAAQVAYDGGAEVRRVPEASQRISTQDFAAASEMLSKAERPLVVVGLGCRPDDVPSLRAFIAATDIPFVATPKAKGSVSEDASGFLGVVGGMALDQVMLDTLGMADVLLGVGFDPVECDKDWYLRDGILNIDRAPSAEASYRPAELLGDIGAILRELSARIQGTLSWPPQLLTERRAAIKARATPNGRAEKLSPLAAIRSLREVLPRETILASDVGSHKYYAGQFWECYEPGRFFMSNGLSGMGYGVPAAIAAKIQRPHVPVVALVGDGGMLMMLHNLVFVHQYQVPIIIVVFVDESLSLIRVAQDRKGYGAYGVDFPAPDFAQVAVACGVDGARVRSVEELKKAVDAAVRTRRATLIQVPIDLTEYYRFV